jgi:hypothetical protein
MITCNGKPVAAMRLKYLCAAALAKQDLRALGLSYRSAAWKTGITPRRLARVLNGQSPNCRLLKKIQSLPKRRVA